jgi:hypothetical protein
LTSLNFSLALGFVATFLLAGLAAASLLHTFRNLAGIELRPLAAGEAFAGGVLPFRLGIEGHRTARFAITLAARGCTPVTVDAIPEAALPVTMELRTPRRGRVSSAASRCLPVPIGIVAGPACVHFPLSGVAFAAPEIAAPLPEGAPGHDLRNTARSR